MKTEKYLVSLLTVAMVLLPLPYFEVAAAGGCTDNLKSKCQKEINGAGAALGAGLTGASAQEGHDLASSQASALNNCASNMAGASSKCSSLMDQCNQCPQQEASSCRTALQSLVSNASGQAGSCAGQGMQSQSTANSMGDMGSVLSALAPLAGMAAMMANQQKDDQPQQPDTSHALQPNGSLDCSKPDAFYYSDCNSQLMSLCNSNMTDYRCVDFYSRYCAGGSGVSGSPSVAAPVTLPVSGASSYTGSGIQIASTTGTATTYQYIPPAQGAAGEGIGTSFCSTVSAYNFCAQGGHDQCPSCLQIQQINSATCQQNPASCLGTNTASALAGGKASCPTDPLYNDANVAAGWGFQDPSTGVAVTATFPTTPSTTTGGSPLPVAVLPQSVSSGGAAMANAKVASAGGAARGTVAANGREGLARGATSLANYANGSNPAAARAVGAANMITAQSVNGVSREVASSGGNLLGNATRTASAGPAPDVQGQFGPSVFAVSSQAIRNLCKARRFANCP